MLQQEISICIALSEVDLLNIYKILIVITVIITIIIIIIIITSIIAIIINSSKDNILDMEELFHKLKIFMNKV